MDAMNPRPNGNLQGCDMAIGNAGTGTGVSDTFGAGVGQEDINSMGSIAANCASDEPEDRLPEGNCAC